MDGYKTPFPRCCFLSFFLCGSLLGFFPPLSSLPRCLSPLLVAFRRCDFPCVVSVEMERERKQRREREDGERARFVCCMYIYPHPARPYRPPVPSVPTLPWPALSQLGHVVVVVVSPFVSLYIYRMGRCWMLEGRFRGRPRLVIEGTDMVALIGDGWDIPSAFRT
ncbi:hypothetical protein F5883DRAFT_64944 [Diaporthe sp. PMI_573]|nr:hypothetical protein F5883DRAFT_64944 [Diaporthaceae sp. PMI_573]